VRRESILMIWIGGFVLAVLLYLVGPDRFFDSVLGFLNAIDAVFRNLVISLGTQAYGVIRAFAIAIYLVFVVLSVLASQRGRHGFWPLIVVSGVFMLLVWRPYADYPAPIGRWIAGLLLVVIAAIIMTQRLMAAPAPRDRNLPPYPPGHTR
jgi:hypothetical protein